MTLPSSGAITFAQIAAEYGLSLPLTIPNDLWGKNGMPSSGGLTVPNSFWGKSNTPGVPSYGITPADDYSAGLLAPSHTFSALAASASQAITSYSWGVASSSGGTFSVASGQGTATATFQVTSVASDSTATATVYCDMVISGTTYRGYATLSHTNSSIN